MKHFFKKNNKNNRTSSYSGVPSSHSTRSFLRRRGSNKGFTIVETLVAIFVLLVSTTGPLAFTQQGLQAAFLARDQVTVFYLAQESIEAIKNVRDGNHVAYLKGENVNWLDDLGDCTPSDVGDTVSCNVRIDGNVIDQESCNGGTCPVLRYDEGMFVHSGGEPSKYTRTVYVTKITEKEIQVIVEVKWESNLVASKRIVVQENIFNKI